MTEEISGSISKSVSPTKPPAKSPIVIPQYRLTIYNKAGQLKQSLPLDVYRDMSICYGDVIRAVSSTRWMTLDEICTATWLIERKLKHPSNRTRKNIELAIQALAERSMVEVR